MQRYTKWQEETQMYTVDRARLVVDRRSCRGEAIQRLARFENLFEQLQQDYDHATELQEQMRLQGQCRCTAYRQLIERRKRLEEMLSYFRIYSGVK